MENLAVLSESANQARPEVKGPHRNRRSHVQLMTLARRNPECEVGRNQPCVVSGRHQHQPPNRIDKLVRSVSVLWDVIALRIFVRQCCHEAPACRVIFGENFGLSHKTYIMAEYYACAMP